MNLRIEILPWAAARDAARAIRSAVFIAEQHVPEELEWDKFDELSWHALAWVDDEPVATGRLLPDGHIGRMAVQAPWRALGVGAAVFAAIMVVARRNGHRTLLLHSQTRATGFYARFGFVPEGPEFEEAGIPHMLMRRNL
ncbi:MAG: GNAT family N-acetyltransferase [Rhodocyclaceae bacterium]|nr:GNAT family N-acetyltransferase [Rhodocyclaceae bacterium]MBX3670319.1 GNAT family N-acetyltransferase [Rhodocyclaceae bacterium]